MDQFQKYYDRALRFLAFRPRSEKEVRENLAEKKAPLEIVSEVIEKLKKQKFVDDLAFTKWWVEQRAAFRPRSPRIIEVELRRKGISKECIDDILHNKEIQELEDQGLRKLAEKKLARYKHLDKRQLYKQVGGFLARRGYDWGRIRRVIDEAIEKEV